MRIFFSTAFLIFLIISMITPMLAYAQSNDTAIAYVGIAYDYADQYSKFKHYVDVKGKGVNSDISCEINFDVTPISLNEKYENMPVLRFLSVRIIYVINTSYEIISYTFSNQVFNAIKTNCSPSLVIIRVGSYEIIGGKIVSTDPSNLIYNISQTPSSPSGPGFDIGGFFASIGSFFQFIGASIQAFFSFVGVAGEVIKYTLVNSFQLLGNITGHDGDPWAEFYAGLYIAQLSQYVNHPVIGKDVQAVLNCQKNLSEVWGLLTNKRPQDYFKTICDIRNEKPTGVIGFLSTIWKTVSSEHTQKIISFVFQNFLIIHAIIFTGILAYGASQMIQQRSIEPMIGSFKAIYSIFKFYFSIGKFIYEMGLKFIQAIASLIEAILPF
jgi:hypothetical protein